MDARGRTGLRVDCRVPPWVLWLQQTKMEHQNAMMHASTSSLQDSQRVLTRKYNDSCFYFLFASLAWGRGHGCLPIFWHLGSWEGFQSRVEGVGVIKRPKCPCGFGNRVSRRLGNRNSDWELFQLWICRQWYLALLQQFLCPLPGRACVVLMPKTREFLLVGSTLT